MTKSVLDSPQQLSCIVQKIFVQSGTYFSLEQLEAMKRMADYTVSNTDQAELKDLKLELFDETQATRDDTRNETRDKFTVALGELKDVKLELFNKTQSTKNDNTAALHSLKESLDRVSLVTNKKIDDLADRTARGLDTLQRSQAELHMWLTGAISSVVCGIALQTVRKMPDWVMAVFLATATITLVVMMVQLWVKSLASKGPAATVPTQPSWPLATAPTQPGGPAPPGAS
ncbi:hypothetical protein WJX75_000258 [Coccomyxa subellipsoidea]|uniref:DUF1640-domain-containing protein n=1 Tax=Coccomyxa subellipsoidea TaxID=248742 RepID=A0ABR2YYQ6_9CHLO